MKLKRSEVEVKRREKKKILPTPTITREAPTAQVNPGLKNSQVNSETEPEHIARVEAERVRQSAWIAEQLRLKEHAK